MRSPSTSRAPLDVPPIDSKEASRSVVDVSPKQPAQERILLAHKQLRDTRYAHRQPSIGGCRAGHGPQEGEGVSLAQRVRDADLLPEDPLPVAPSLRGCRLHLCAPWRTGGI